MNKKDVTLKSMTGFGRATLTLADARFDVEIQALNRRHLEINFLLPKPLMRYESELRGLVTHSVGRGQVNVTVFWKSDQPERISVTADLDFAKALKEAWENIAEELHIPCEFSLSLLAQEKGLLLCEERVQEGALEDLKRVLLSALVDFDHARGTEGKALQEDLQRQTTLLRELIDRIEEHSAQATLHYRQKLSTRLAEFYSSDPLEDERILKEIALFAEKVDISEEIVRFKSHLEQYQKLLLAPLIDGEVKGKKLEFLLQELFREINTIGSKANNALIASAVIDAKCALERMREQVQNIE